jgi:hypothetical protein
MKQAKPKGPAKGYKPFKRTFYKPKKVTTLRRKTSTAHGARRKRFKSAGRGGNKSFTSGKTSGRKNDFLTNNLNPHSLMTKPVKFHKRLTKEERRVRLPDASDKDKKIAACATLGNFYKNRNKKQYRNVKSSYKMSTKYLDTEEQEIDQNNQNVDNRQYNNPPIFVQRKIQTLLVNPPRHLLVQHQQPVYQNPQLDTQNLSKTNLDMNTLRSYEDIMDKHALHIFYVRNGKIMHESPEFESFKRVYSHRMEELKVWLDLLESVCKRLNVKLLKVNGGKLLKFVLKQVKPTVPLIVSCLTRQEDLEFTQNLEK